ncbi:hypothetical protein [Erythrobacter sp. JK5]|uniref:hypothetical protein n=1 Tax=Erythrobacter sp. JK5 TaxID=2829500 RepID=UPI001BAD4B8E|nr:hypothetical protein [Erythrobacter sp. JK5]QUL38014.1 hypothetical protein KDC96_00850 [Erythrobacter sp. JK5]
MLTKISLLIMRIGTGGLLVVWGLVRAVGGMGQGLADKYYSGVGSDVTLQLAYGWAEIALGLLVILGLFRTYTLIGSAVILVGGAIPLWRHFLDPFGEYLFASPDDANILFFPSLTVAGAALALIALRRFDTLALDSLFGKKASDTEI